MSNKRISGLDFVRVVSAIGIIAFHFYCHSSSEGKLFYGHANGMWGGTLNYLFFILSGLLLHMKYKDMKSIKTFYYKRWKAMMPAYIIVFLFAYLMNVMQYGSFFYLPIPRYTLLLSFVGLDGYHAWITNTYMITGEWFLGAVLICYYLYPLLNKCFKKNRYLTVGILLVIYEAVLYLNPSFLPWPFATKPIVCILCFSIGMLLSEYFDYLNRKSVFIVSGLITLFMIAYPIPFDGVTKEIITGLVLLITLYNIGELLCKDKHINSIVFEISGLTYYTFLLHHTIIYKMLTGWDKTDTFKAFIILLSIIIITFTFAKILDILMKKIFESKIFKKLDNYIIGK